jgi:hypothetical protein
MSIKQAAALLAFMALGTPAAAFDSVQTIFYVGIPLERQAAPLSFGLRLQNRDYQAVDIDTRMLHFFALGGIEAKWVLAGAVAVGAAAAARGDKRAEQRAAAHQPASPPPCPQLCN